MTRFQTALRSPCESIGQMWNSGIDILEYQSPALLRELAATPQARRLWHTLGFVLLAALLGSLFALISGILTSTALEAWLRSLLTFLLTFFLNSVAAFGLARLLGGKAAFRPFLYVTALYSVPLQMIETVLVILVSLIPVVGFYLLLLLALASAGIRIYLSNLTVQSLMEFPHRWQRVIMLLGLVAIALLIGVNSLLG